MRWWLVLIVGCAGCAGSQRFQDTAAYAAAIHAAKWGCTHVCPYVEALPEPDAGTQ